MIRPASGSNEARRGRLASPFFIQIIAFVIAVALLFSVQHDFTHERRSPFLAVNAELLPHLVLGFQMFTADLLWLRLIQDFDHKSAEKTEKGWVFQMLDGITRLDTRFRIAYATGATVLSILVRDVEGARIIFERAAKKFPSDWSLLYRAGYHSLYEVKDCRQAAEYFNGAVFSGAPQWVASLASRLYQRSGQYEIAKTVLIDAIERFKGSDIEPRLRERLKNLEKRNETTSKDTNKAILECNPPDMGA